MIGQTISHYRITELLGAGGMGVVYKAEDSRLRRAVALKFLPPELTRDREARDRLMHEAQAASALDHPNICTIYEVDETADGGVFLAMAYYPGETLKQRLGRGPLPEREALAIAGQIARAVAAAHEAGIIHRDIKPANVMLTTSGDVKLVDFGIAKLSGRTMLTKTGTTIGTIAYMAPEQVAGLEADARTDVWALGVVLYEMLSGEQPFTASNEAALLNSILRDTPRALAREHAEIGDDLQAIVWRALQKDRTTRYGSAREFLDDLSRVQAARAPVALAAATSRPLRAVLRPRVAIPVVVLVLIGAGAVGWSVHRASAARQFSAAALVEIRQLIAQDNYAKALIVARDTERVAGSGTDLDALVREASITQAVRTNPPGATVFVRDAALRSDWMPLGTTPIEHATVPQGVLRWKFERPGHVTAEFIRAAASLPDRLDLTPGGGIPERMIRIPGGAVGVLLTGYDYNRTVAVAAYLIDRYEVTNREFKEFVDSGEYRNRQHWTYPFVNDGRAIPWDEAMSRFRDRTGRPGPSSWEVGAYPAGQDDYPISGVSWYEAAAYAAFRGRSLPTVYHWVNAAGTTAAAQVTPLSNFGGAPLEVGRSPAVSPWGLSDVAGNVREWCLNEMDPGRTRYILGGAATDADYMFVYADARSAWDRSPGNGFRTVKYLTPDSIPDASIRPIPCRVRKYENEKPVSVDVFRAYSSQFAYDPAPLAALVEKVDDSAPGWRRERVSFAASDGKERIPAYVLLPKSGRPPYQTVLFWPGSSVIRLTSSDPPAQMASIDWLVLGGRAVVYPVLYGTYERRTTRDSTWPEMTRGYTDWATRGVNDARRAVDYIESRPDLRHDQIGYLGLSWGGRMGPIVLALDRRLTCAVFLSGGFSPTVAPPQVDPFNFAPRVTVPVLMINGAQDFIFSVEGGQKPLFRALGTPPERKRHVVLPANHSVWSDKRNDVIREALDWFDRYLGPVR